MVSACIAYLLFFYKFAYMKLIRSIIALFMGIASTTASAQGLPAQHHREVVKNGFFVSESGYNYKALAKEITSEAKTKYEQAQMIYLWLCQNISFDQAGIIRTADRAYDNRRAVCQGFCELYYRLAEPLKLDVTLIYGKAKSAIKQNTEDHVWLSIKTEEGQILADPTWGAGTIHNGSFGQNPYPLIWFDVNPCQFIYTHFPKQKKYQYISPTISEDTFRKMPYATPVLE